MTLLLLVEGSSLDEVALPDIGPQLVRMLLVLGGLILVLLLAAKLLPRWLGARFGGLAATKGPGKIEILERRPLDSRSSLYLVKVGGHAYLVGRSESGLVRLSGEELDQAALETANAPPSFAERLATAAPPTPPGASS